MILIRIFFGWLTISFYNLLLFLNIVTKERTIEIVTTLCTEAVYRNLEEKLISLHKKYPNDIDLKRDIMMQVCHSKFLEMRTYINSIVWKRDISDQIYSDLEKNFMRKISWSLRCNGFVLEKE